MSKNTETTEKKFRENIIGSFEVLVSIVIHSYLISSIIGFLEAKFLHARYPVSQTHRNAGWKAFFPIFISGGKMQLGTPSFKRIQIALT